VSHNAWLEDDVLVRGADALAETPGILINGRFDFQSPLANAWALKKVWPKAQLLVVDNAGHAADAAISHAIIDATDKFAPVR